MYNFIDEAMYYKDLTYADILCISTEYSKYENPMTYQQLAKVFKSVINNRKWLFYRYDRSKLDFKHFDTETIKIVD